MFRDRGVNRSEFGEGFTIIELTITIAIVALLSATIVGYQRDAGNRRELTLDAQKVMQDLRRVQNYALSAKAALCGTQTVVVNYGVRFVPSTNLAVYQIFKDCSGNKLWASSETEETVRLSYSSIRTISPNYGGTLQVVFIPPAPDTAVNGNSTTAGRTASMTICHRRKTSVCKSIVVNEKGAISVQ